jgi:8-amino-7-oxononanoate synthase
VLKASKYLFERGVWVTAIRAPTVPKGTARLRITLSAAHSLEQLERLLNLLSELKTKPVDSFD